MKRNQDHTLTRQKTAAMQWVSMLRGNLLLLFLLGGLFHPVHSQDITFNEVVQTDGTDFEFVTGITQAENGMMWFATKLGVFRYDGHSMTSYKNNPVYPNSLVSNFTESIFADKDGKIWIGTLGSGLDHFDPETGIFTHYRHNPEDPSSISNDTVTEIHRDRQGTLWVGTHGGLNQLDDETNTFVHFRHDPDDATSLSNNQVRALYEDREGTLWIGTGSPYADNGGGPEAGGLNRMDKKSGSFTRYLHDPADDNTLMNNKISAIFEDDQGTLWIGTAGNGTHKMDRQSGTFERTVADPSNPGSPGGPAPTDNMVPYEHIAFITQDARGAYWFGTVESGLHYVDPATGKSQRFHRNEGPPSGFMGLGAWSAFSSRDGILWIGTPSGEIYRINPLQLKLPHLETPDRVNRVYETPAGDLWIATDNKIIKKEKRNGSTRETVIDLIPGSDENEYVQLIEEDRQGNLWIGGDHGLSLWNEKNREFIHYSNLPGDPQSLSNNSVLKVYEDRNGTLWVGTVHGINRMNREKGTFERFYLNLADTGFVGRNIVTSITEDFTGQLWTGLWNGVGIYSFDPESKEYKNYLSGSSIVFIYEDSYDDLWAGSNFGLFRYNREADVFQRYLDQGMTDGVSFVASLIEDDRHYLWFTTNKGISRINPQRTETNTMGKTYGLDGVDFSWNSVYKGRDGHIYFGDDSGYYVFDPVSAIDESKVPEIALTGFRLADQAVLPGPDSPLKEDLRNAKEIRLRYDQTVFSFDFAIIDYANPRENNLIYYLENYDNTWMKPNSEQRAYYFNIPPGKYTFRVKGTNSYGIWAEKKINITILPPWYQTWWAYGSYAIILGLLVFAFDRVQRRRIKAIERQKAYKRELAQAKEIEKAYTELKATQSQLIQAEKMASLGELTAGIAHEIQNPLNFVNNFSELNTELITELEEERKKEVRDLENEDDLLKSIKENEQKINHHGKRADGIVKSMLQHSRSNSNQKEPTDINALADEYLRLAYHGLRARDKSFNADFHAELDPALPKLNVVAQDIGRVLLNLINNAFFAVDQKAKHLGETYVPRVTIQTKTMGNQVEISVTDNGDGIPETLRKKIFQPFFTTKSTGEGTGLGLSLSYDIITKGHGGELLVESQPGSGSTFIVRLPLKNTAN